MKWHSLLKDPTDLPQRINNYEESEDVMVIIKILNDKGDGFDYIQPGYICYYGHWKPNGEEGWRVRTKDFGDCGKFGGFDNDTKFSEFFEDQNVDADELEQYGEEEYKQFVKSNCKYDKDSNSYTAVEVVGWTYFPNEDEFIEENKDLLAN